MADKGPIYGVELIDSLPMDPNRPKGMRQAMPSQSDLEGIKDYRQGQRVVAGYEVLLNHYLEAKASLSKMSHRKCWECQHVAYYRDHIFPACKCEKCGSHDTRLIR